MNNVTQSIKATLRGTSRAAPRTLAFGTVMLLVLALAGCPAQDGGQSPADGNNGAAEGGGQQAADQAPAGRETVPAPGAAQGREARSAAEILNDMVATYKQATNYADKGRVTLRGTFNGQPVDTQQPYTTAFERPNRLRLELYSAAVVSDGTDLFGSVAPLPDQILKVSAPETIDLSTIFRDPILAEMMMQGPTQAVSWLPPPLLLMVADDPLKTILYQAEKPQLLPPGTLREASCNRVQIRRADGALVLWIERETNLLLRADYPTEQITQAMGAQRVMGLSIAADFVGAELDTELPPEAFQFEVPPTADLATEFQPQGADLLGKTVDDFSFVDLEGNQVTKADLAGKPVLLQFWTAQDPNSQLSLLEVQTIYEEFADKVAIYTVNVDPVAEGEDGPGIDNATVASRLEAWRVDLPTLRDPDNAAEEVFGLTVGEQMPTLPALLVLGPDSVVQALHIGATPRISDALAGSLEKLLSGVQLYEERREVAEQRRRDLEKVVTQAAAQGLYTLPIEASGAVASAEIAPASEPENIAREELFRCEALSSPVNPFTYTDADGTRRLCVVEGGRSVAELNWDGTVAQTHELELPASERIDFIRPTQEEGQQYFVAWGLGGQQIFVYDEQWQPVAQYPRELQTPHDGLADVVPADINGDGKLELLAGYLGVVGVHAADLSGQRLWANRTAAVAFRLVALEPDAQGQRNILATNTTRGTAVLIDSQGQRIGEVAFPNHDLGWLAGGDLNDDGQTDLCGLDPVETDQIVAFGFDLDGNVLWEQELPRGLAEHPFDQVTWGPVFPRDPPCWVIAGPDGSIRLVSQGGDLLDEFNTGMALSGLLVTDHDGAPVIVVTAQGRVVGWRFSTP